MNDEPNTIDWNIGDIVIHDADAKDERMLMVVTGYDKKNKLYHTRYLNPRYTRTNQIWENDKKYLHDPSRSNIKIPTEGRCR